MALIVMGAPARAPAEAMNAPLAPSGKWIVDYGESACLLSRDYGTGADKVTLGFRPMPMSDMADLMLVTAGHGNRFSWGKARVQLEQPGQPGGRHTDGIYRAALIPEKPLRLHTITIDGTALDALDTASVLSITIGKAAPVRIQARGMTTALAALSKCQDTLLRSWGIDPREDDHVDRPAEAVGRRSEWIAADDYPVDALNAHVTGTVLIAWAIGLDGRVSDCRVVQTSGTGSLDTAACVALTRRARYTPAIGKDGKPMITHRTRRVTWSL